MIYVMDCFDEVETEEVHKVPEVIKIIILGFLWAFQKSGA